MIYQFQNTVTVSDITAIFWDRWEKELSSFNRTQDFKRVSVLLILPFFNIIKILIENNFILPRALCDAVALSEHEKVAQLLVQALEQTQQTSQLLKSCIDWEIARSR